MVEAIGAAIISSFFVSASLGSAVAAITVAGVSLATIVGGSLVLDGSHPVTVTPYREP